MNILKKLAELSEKENELNHKQKHKQKHQKSKEYLHAGLEIILTNSIQYSTMYYIEKGVDIMAFSIRLNEEEKSLADSYAKLHSLSLGEAFKKALFEKIEDEYDIAIADEAYKEYVIDGKKSRPIGELWNECEL